LKKDILVYRERSPSSIRPRTFPIATGALLTTALKAETAEKGGNAARSESLKSVKANRWRAPGQSNVADDRAIGLLVGGLDGS